MAGWRRNTKVLVQLFACVLVQQSVACGPCWDIWYSFSVRGQLLDRDTLEPITVGAYGGRSLLGDEELDYSPALIFDGSPNYPPLEEDGSFTLHLGDGWAGSCYLPLEHVEIPPLTRPDQIEVIVVREGCEQRFLINLNADTVVDMSFPDDVIELQNPILVGPCEE